jgi:hypothetical protein
MITRRKKQIYLAVTLVAVLALAVDRLVLTGASSTPQQAAAGPPQADDAPATASSLPADKPMLSIPELPFPKGLRPPYDPNGSIRDLFQPPDLVRVGADADEPDKDDPGAPNAGTPDYMSATTFASEHRLEGVVVQQRLRIAVVDGVWMRIGKSLDGCTLTAIAGNSAEFSCGDGTVVLKVNAAETLLPH